MSTAIENEERFGIAVYCTLCGMQKKPHGRSEPFGAVYCNDDCEGYNQDPKPGCLWPGESASGFGFPTCDNATEMRPRRQP